MRVLLLEADEALLAERARLGLDVRDELWDGVLHVTPAPMMRHQVLGAQLLRHLGGAADDRGLQLTYETGLFRPGAEEWRVPDLVAFDAADASARGVEGRAACVIEIVSPGDTSLEKVPFYLEVGVTEVVLIDRDTLHVRVFRALDHDGRPVVAQDTTARSLAATLRRVSDDHLQMVLPDRTCDVRLGRG